MAALLSAVLDFTDKVSAYIPRQKKLNINVLPPDINESEAGFIVSDENIRFGLVAGKI
jgi:DNA polymerase-3 subunit alpha